jgi:hypothetical protein
MGVGFGVCGGGPFNAISLSLPSFTSSPNASDGHMKPEIDF